MSEAYDPNVCYLSLIEENYLFILERSGGSCDASDSQRCAWDLQNEVRVPKAFPSNASDPQTYYCDGNYHSLPWSIDLGEAGSVSLNGSSSLASGGQGGGSSSSSNTDPNGYKCVCGGPIDNTLTHGRTDRPWQGAFGKRCNAMTDFQFTKGDFGSTYDATQGVCATMAGQSHDASLVVQGNFAFPDDGLTTIDRYGIVYFCDGSPIMYNNVQEKTGRVCNCDGPLPETVFGQQLTKEQRDRCGLESAKKKEAGIIAGSVVGSVLAIGLVAALVAILYLHRRKQKRKSHDTTQSQGDDESMDSGVELMDKSPQRAYNSI